MQLKLFVLRLLLVVVVDLQHPLQRSSSSVKIDGRVKCCYFKLRSGVEVFEF